MLLRVPPSWAELSTALIYSAYSTEDNTGTARLAKVDGDPPDSAIRTAVASYRTVDLSWLLAMLANLLCPSLT
jgi:hypothetical protein